jgi:hypothetical protein
MTEIFRKDDKKDAKDDRTDVAYKEELFQDLNRTKIDNDGVWPLSSFHLKLQGRRMKELPLTTVR